ncbi:hypothetical protein F4604DRAFT_1686554 [Suillus subluteus]|nr:hypothetical protein F4604DRAFT_1686554 [Suillus subluteus]
MSEHGDTTWCYAEQWTRHSQAKLRKMEECVWTSTILDGISGWGFLMHIVTSSLFFLLQLVFIDSVTATHGERVTHYGLQGRTTNVVPVISEALAQRYTDIQDGMVAKIFWGEVNCTSEPKISDKVEEILLWHHAFTNPTSAFRDVPDPTTGSGMLYILIFPKLHPITKLQDRTFRRATSLCGRKGSIIPRKMTWYEIDGKLMGVLSDYDLSSLANDAGPRGNERTGMVPLMALDLLTEEGQRGEVKHL